MPFTLLIAERSPEIRVFLRRSLLRRYAGVAILEGQTVKEVSDVLRTRAVSCILANHLLSDGSAFDILALAHQYRYDIPLIGMGSLGDASDRLMAAGAVAFLKKPFTVEQLMAVLQRLPIGCHLDLAHR